MDKIVLNYKGYTGEYSYSTEDNCYYGKITNIKDLVTFETDTKELIKYNFEEAVDDYIETNKELDDSSTDQTAADDHLDYLESRY